MSNSYKTIARTATIDAYNEKMIKELLAKNLKFLVFSQKGNIIIIVFAVLGFFIFSSLFTYVYFAKDLKSKESIMNRNSTGIVLTDRHGVPFFTFYSAHTKTFVPLSKIPTSTKNAIIAAEDKDFYSHPGFSIEGMLRALMRNTEEHAVVEGGSTITQQLVKNALLNPKRDVLRKFQEIVLAQEIERRYSKDEILEMYINSVYFGNGAFGIEEAAQRYFGKPASQLSLAESSVLAGLLPAPSAYSPLNGNEEEAKKRQLYVLNNMVKAKKITEKEKDIAYHEKLAFSSKNDAMNSVAPHFAIMVRDELIKKYGEENIIRSGYKVRTSIDLKTQKYAESVVKEGVANLAANNASNGSAVIIDPRNGNILAMVGSADWYNKKDGKVNVALQARQPGSSFKPLVYALALEERKITPATILHDKPTVFAGNYKPQNYDNRFRGNVLVRRALANSLNVPSVEVMTMLNVSDVLEKAKEAGITTLREPQDYGLSLILGTGEVKLLELTNAYAAFANNGTWNKATAVLEINDKMGRSIYKQAPQPKQVWDPGVAFLISSILSDNSARQEEFGNSLTISRQAAVKTGTTENYRDAWTLGYTPQVAIGVWVGNNDGQPMDSVAGSLGAAPIWKKLMEHVLEGKKEVAFKPPEDVVAASICAYNGLLAQNSTFGARQEYFLSGTQPNKMCYPPRIARQGDENNNRENLPPGISPESPEQQPQNLDQLRQEIERLREETRQNSWNRGRGSFPPF